MFFVYDYTDFAVVFVAVIVADDDVTAAVFDVAVYAVIAVVVFHLIVVLLVLFVVSAVVSDFEIDDCDSAVAWYYFKTVLMIILRTLMILPNLLFVD